MPENSRIARCGVEEAGQHLQACCFAGAVGPEEADDLTLVDREGDFVDGLDVPRLPMDEAL